MFSNPEGSAPKSHIIVFDGERALVAGWDTLTWLTAEGATSSSRGEHDCLINQGRGLSVGPSVMVDIPSAERFGWPDPSSQHPMKVCRGTRAGDDVALALGPRTQVFATWLGVAGAGISAVLSTSDGVVFARFEPCDQAPVCRDDDACTQDVMTDQGCEHRRLGRSACR